MSSRPGQIPRAEAKTRALWRPVGCSGVQRVSVKLVLGYLGAVGLREGQLPGLSHFASGLRRSCRIAFR
jgi:hypothetical protein